MYVCICKKVTDSQIRRAVYDKGISTMRGIRNELGACSQCGKCAADTKQIIRECTQEKSFRMPAAIAVS